MSEQNNNHTMQVGIGYNVDTSNIEQLSRNLENVNRFTQSMAQGFRDAEQAVDGLADAQERYQQAVNNTRRTSSAYVRQIQDEVRANTIARQQEEDATQSAIRQLNEYAEALRELINISNGQERNFYVHELAQVNTAIDNYQKQALSGYIKYENAKLAETKRVNKQALQAEKDKVKALKDQWEKSANEYKSIQAQLSATSSLKDFSATSTSDMLKHNIVNASLQLTGIRALTSEFQNLSNEIVNINYNTINTQRIMGDFSDELATSLEKNAAQIARLTNIQITDAQEIQSAWVRINDTYASSEEALNKIALATAKFMNVGEITDAEEAVKLVNSTMLQFNLTVDEGIETLNKWAYMADKTAMGTADEYGEAIAKIGGYISSLEGDVDDAIVLTSILGDRLAKSGDEAGNSLKTLTSYLTRTKTTTLFDEIVAQTNNMDFSLRNVNGTFKDFNGLMEAASSAYNYFANQGTQVGDEMAKKIQEAIGATRQGDVALVLLNDWNTESQKYYDMINDSISGEQSYLDEQNQALLKTFSGAWNELRTNILDFGMTLSRNGAMEGITVLMNGIGGLLKLLNNIPEPIIQFGEALVGLKIAQAVGGYIGDLTGITEKYQVLMNQGTKIEIDNANAVSKNANAYFARMEAMKDVSRFTEDDIVLLHNQKIEFDELNNAYNTGQINAEQYSKAVSNLIGEEQLSANATHKSVEALLQDNNITRQHIALTEKETAVSKKNIAATNTKTVTTKKDTTAILQNNFVKGKKIATDAIAIAKEKLLGLAIVDNTNKTNLGTIATNLLSTAMSGAATVAGVLSGALGAIMSALGPIMAIWSLGSIIDSMFFSKDTTDNLSELNTQLQETESKLQELEDLRDSSGGLTVSQQAELEYYKALNIEIKDIIENKKKLNAYEATFGGDGKWWFGLGPKDNLKNNTTSELKEFESLLGDFLYQQELVEKAMDAGDINTAQLLNVDLKEISRDLTESQSKLATFGASWKENMQYLSGDDLESAQGYLNKINDALGKISSNDINLDIDNEFAGIAESESFDTLFEKIDKAKEKSSELQDYMDKIFDGSITSDEIAVLTQKYDGFWQVANGGAQDQIRFLKQIQLENEDAMRDDVYDSLLQRYEELEAYQEKLSQHESGEISLDSSEIETANDRIKILNEEINKLESIGQLYIEANIKLPDLGDITEAMENLVSSTSDLVEAQNKLAQGTALSRQELYNLAMTYPELLYQSDLFNTSTVEGQQEAINAVMQMKEDEFNGKIDLQIEELEVQKEFIQGILDQEQNKYDILAQAAEDRANGELETEAQVQEMLGQYNDAIGEQFTLAEQYKADKVVEGGEARVDAENKTGEKTVDAANEAGEGIADAIIEGSATGVDGASKNSGLLGNIFERIKGWASNLATWVAKAFAGDESGAGAVSGDGVTGDRTSTFKKATYDEVDKTINGQTIDEWIKTQKEALKLNVEAYKVQLKQLDNAITNLETFKKEGLANISNKYSDSGALGDTTPSDKAAEASEKAAEAAEDAAKALEEAAEAIEKYTEEYIKNVESLQDRIAKALKKKYQEQYDERKKLLKEEHNARVEQIQAEIDKINGDTPEDKQAQLASLQKKYQQWLADDSTLGKAKQKEYLDQIEELKKEIKIDELESQLDDENDKYDKSIDQDSQFYDAILKKLDKQMTDEMLYREANDMIRNGKIQEITDLLTEYDAQWDGWATLMGKTAGEIIADEVALAIANYLDVVNGTVTENGGKYTNSITGGTTLSSSSSSVSSSASGSNNTSSTTTKTVTKGGKAKISNTSAGMYYTSTSRSAVGNWKGYSGNYYVVNDNNGRAALAKSNNINAAIGWIDKKYLIGLATGGYTGNNEGLALLHQKERVLNAQQTSAFEHLVYDFLPRISSELLNPIGDTYNGNNVTFNKELVKVDIGTVVNNKQFDVDNGIDNLDRAFRQSLKKSGIVLKK